MSMESSLECMSMALFKNTGTATIDKINVFQRKYLAACIPAKLAHLDKETWRNVCNALLGNRFLAQTNGSQPVRKKQKNGSGAYASASMELFLLRRENDSIDMKVCMCK